MGKRNHRQNSNLSYNGNPSQEGYSDRSQGGYAARTPRPRLEWQNATNFDFGHVRTQVQTAEGQNGRMYSVSVGRVRQRDGEEQVMRFIQDRDIKDAIDGLEAAEDWIRKDAGDGA